MRCPANKQRHLRLVPQICDPNGTDGNTSYPCPSFIWARRQKAIHALEIAFPQRISLVAFERSPWMRPPAAVPCRAQSDGRPRSARALLRLRKGGHRQSGPVQLLQHSRVDDGLDFGRGKNGSAFCGRGISRRSGGCRQPRRRPGGGCAVNTLSSRPQRRPMQPWRTSVQETEQLFAAWPERDNRRHRPSGPHGFWRRANGRPTKRTCCDARRAVRSRCFILAAATTPSAGK